MPTTTSTPTSGQGLLAGLSVITVINLKHSDDDSIKVIAAGPDEQGKYAGVIATPEGRIIIHTKPSFATSEDAEAHMHRIIAAARNWTNPETKGPVKLRLTLDVTYQPGTTPVADLISRLQDIAAAASAQGQLTGDSSAEVQTWAARVDRVSPSPASPEEILRVLAADKNAPLDSTIRISGQCEHGNGRGNCQLCRAQS